MTISVNKRLYWKVDKYFNLYFLLNELIKRTIYQEFGRLILEARNKSMADKLIRAVLHRINSCQLLKHFLLRFVVPAAASKQKGQIDLSFNFSIAFKIKIVLKNSYFSFHFSAHYGYITRTSCTSSSTQYVTWSYSNINLWCITDNVIGKKSCSSYI